MSKREWLTARLPEPYYLPTPSFGINRALGGKGLSSGRVHLYWGPKASGKTTLALQQIALAQKEGKKCAFLDSERAFEKSWAIKNGVNVDDLQYDNTLIVEEALELVMPSLADGHVDLLVVDSINSLNYKSFFDDPTSQGMGTYSRSSKMFTHKVLQTLGFHQQVILIGQQSMHHAGTKFVTGAAIGSAIDHWTSTQVKFRKTGAKRPDKDKDGTFKPDVSKEWRTDGSFRVHWRIEKSKQSTYPVEGSYYFNPYTAEIDFVDEVIDAAKETSLLTGSTWLAYKAGTDDEMKWNGKGKLRQYLMEHNELYEELVSELNKIDVEIANPSEEDDE